MKRQPILVMIDKEKIDETGLMSVLQEWNIWGMSHTYSSDRLQRCVGHLSALQYALHIPAIPR